MAQAQRLYARDLPDLQHNKMMTSEGMKGVSDLDRSQRLTGPMCSSKQPCQPSKTRWHREQSLWYWRPFMSRTFCHAHTASGLGDLRIKRGTNYPASLRCTDSTGCLTLIY